MSEGAMLSPLAAVPEQEQRALLEAGRRQGRITIAECCRVLKVASVDDASLIRIRLWLEDHGIELVMTAESETATTATATSISASGASGGSTRTTSSATTSASATVVTAAAADPAAGRD